jgi:hypothetical protein
MEKYRYGTDTSGTAGQSRSERWHAYVVQGILQIIGAMFHVDQELSH